MEPTGRREAPPDDRLRTATSPFRRAVGNASMAPTMLEDDWNAVDIAVCACAAGLACGTGLRPIRRVRPLHRRQAAAVCQEQLPAEPRPRQPTVLRRSRA